MITPSLIFLMLFVTFCRVKPRQMKPSMLHVWLLLFQVVVSAALYFALLPLDAIVAQGAMICVLAPVGDGRGGDCGHVGGQRSDDGDLQPAVQYGDRVDRARRAFAGRNRGLFFHADTGPASRRC